MNTTKRDVQDEKLYFIQSIDGQVSNGGHSNNTNGKESHPKMDKEIVDIKDVELTLLPSYLHDKDLSANVMDNTDLLQSISKPNPQLSPPKRPPRANQSPEGSNYMQIATIFLPDFDSDFTVVPLERINVQVNVNGTPPLSSSEQGPHGTSAAPQTLSDLKKQRSMHRVAQQNSPPMTAANHGTPASQQQESSTATSGGRSRESKNNNKSSHSHSKSSKSDEERPRERSGSSKRSKNGQHRGSSQQRRNNSSRKKFAATEVVGPSPKKVGCCRVM